MKFWQSTAFNDPSELVTLAKVAEQAGFDGALLSEHLFIPANYEPAYLYSDSGRPDFDTETPFPDPWVTIAALAAATTTLRFCTLIYILPLRHPLEIAKPLAALSLYSNNRVILGVGAGWMKEEFDAVGVDFKTRGRRLDEMIGVLRELWKGELCEHHGEFFDFDALVQKPAPPDAIPISIGGASKPALRRAARLGDGWLGAGDTPDKAAEILKTLRQLRVEAGRENEPFETIVPLTEPPEVDSLRRLSELGADGIVNYPFVYTAGRNATLQQKIDMMRRYGDEVIAPMKDL